MLKNYVTKVQILLELLFAELSNNKNECFRLVSAYKNKFEIPKFIKMFGNLTFPAFIEMIVEKRERTCPTYSSCHYNKHWLPYIAKSSKLSNH